MPRQTGTPKPKMLEKGVSSAIAIAEKNPRPARDAARKTAKRSGSRPTGGRRT